jgi:hypothetical protein
MTARPTPRDYEILDRYLEVTFQLLEGIADVVEARQTLRSYLELHRREHLPPEMEQLLKELFVEKCHREGDDPGG